MGQLAYLAGFWLVSARLLHSRLFPFRTWPRLYDPCGPWPPLFMVRVILRAHMRQDGHVDNRDGILDFAQVALKSLKDG